MKLAVTDANIFIDLIHTDLIGHLFSIDHEIHTCLEVFDELNEKQQRVLTFYQQGEKLTIHALTVAEQDQAMLGLPRALSTTDGNVLYLAKKLQASIPTGDGALRKHSLKLNFEVHGILWLFECFHDGQFVSTVHCIEKLKQLIDYNDRLPKAECDKLLEKWSKIL